jgi:hypothetical protein
MEPTKRPVKSRSSGKTYKIVYKDEGTLKHDDGTECVGLSDHRKQTILIEEGQTLDNECDTLLHEVLHQLIAAYGVHLPDDMEEWVCATLGGALFAHVRDNPDFWRYIFKAAVPPKQRRRRSGTERPSGKVGGGGNESGDVGKPTRDVAERTPIPELQDG